MELIVNKFYKSLLLLFMVSTAHQACALESSRHKASAEATGLFVGVACGLGVAGYLRYRVSQVNALEAVEVARVTEERSVAATEAKKAKESLENSLNDTANFDAAKRLALKVELSQEEEQQLIGYFKPRYLKADFEIAIIWDWYKQIEDAERKKKQKEEKEREFANAKKPFSRTWPIAIPLGAAAGIVAAKLWMNAQKTPLCAS